MEASLVSEAAQHLGNHWGDILTGATFIGIVAHAVNTFPVPANIYAAWFLGVVQYVVGQRARAANTMAGAQSVVFAEAKPNKDQP